MRLPIPNAVYYTLAYMAHRHYLETNGGNVLRFWKSEFTRTYRMLLRMDLVGWRKYETLWRSLRKAAENRVCVEYIDKRKGRYKLYVSCLEADPRWRILLRKLEKLEAEAVGRAV